MLLLECFSIILDPKTYFRIKKLLKIHIFTTTCWPPSTHLVTTWWPLCDHLVTTWWPLGDHFFLVFLIDVLVLIAPNLCYKVMQNSLNSFWVVMHGGCVAGYYWVYLTFLASIVTNWWGAHFPCCQILHVFISQKRSGCAQNHPTRSMNVSQLHFRTGALGTIRIILLSNSCHFIFISLSGAKLMFLVKTEVWKGLSVCQIFVFDTWMMWLWLIKIPT